MAFPPLERDRESIIAEEMNAHDPPLADEFEGLMREMFASADELEKKLRLESSPPSQSPERRPRWLDYVVGVSLISASLAILLLASTWLRGPQPNRKPIDSDSGIANATESPAESVAASESRQQNSTSEQNVDGSIRHILLMERANAAELEGLLDAFDAADSEPVRLSI